MKKVNFLFITVTVLILGGCSNQYVVTFDSSPQGASLVCGGKNWGYTPRKLYYDESVKSRATINVSDCSANWVSGARENYPSNLKVYPEGGTIITLPRPNEPDAHIDHSFALQVQQNQQMNQVLSNQQEMQAEQQRVKNQQQQQNNKDYLCSIGLGYGCN